MAKYLWNILTLFLIQINFTRIDCSLTYNQECEPSKETPEALFYQGVVLGQTLSLFPNLKLCNSEKGLLCNPKTSTCKCSSDPWDWDPEARKDNIFTRYGPKGSCRIRDGEGCQFDVQCYTGRFCHWAGPRRIGEREIDGKCTKGQDRQRSRDPPVHIVPNENENENEPFNIWD